MTRMEFSHCNRPIYKQESKQTEILRRVEMEISLVTMCFSVLCWKGFSKRGAPALDMTHMSNRNNDDVMMMSC